LTIGKVPSLNQFYASKHWIARKKARDLLHAEISKQLRKIEPVSFEQCQIEAWVNYRYDLDNCIMAIKFATDAFRDWGGIPDDSPKYIKAISINYDPSLPKDTAKIFFSRVLQD
jgi:hypothetical protein